MVERTVGLAFDGDEIRAVEVETTRRSGTRCLRAASIAIPPPGLEDGAISDPSVIAEALSTLWTSAEFSSRRVRVAVDGRLAVLRRTEIPVGNGVDLREAAAYDIAELLSYPIDEAVYDVAVLDEFERDGRSWVKALVVSVSAAVVETYRQALSQASLTLVEADSLGDAMAGALDLDGRETNGASLVVDVGDAVTSVFLFDEDGVLFARTIEVGVSADSVSLAEELESELAILSGDDSMPDRASAVSGVIEAVRRTTDYFVDIDGRPLTSIVLSGSRSHAPSLMSGLEHALGIPVRNAEPRVAWPEDGPGYCGFEVALGAALDRRAGYRPARRLELRSETDRSSLQRRRERLAAAMLTLLVALLAGFDGYHRRVEASAASAAAASEEAATDDVHEQVLVLDDAMLEKQELEVGEEQVRRLTGERIRFLDVLQEAAETMPRDSQLVSVQLRRGTSEFSSPTANERQVLGVATFSGIAADLDVVGRWLTDVEDGQLVADIWLSQSIKGEVGEAESDASFFVAEGVITAAAQGQDPHS